MLFGKIFITDGITFLHKGGGKKQCLNPITGSGSEQIFRLTKKKLA